MKLIVDQRGKAVFLIEQSGLVVDRLHFDGVNPEIVGQRRAPVEGVKQQKLPQVLALDGLINGQAGQENYGHRMPGEFLRQSSLQIRKRNRARGEREVAKHLRITRFYGDVRSPEVPLLVLTNQRANKVIKGGLATGECRSHVVAIELLDKPISHGGETA